MVEQKSGNRFDKLIQYKQVKIIDINWKPEEPQTSYEKLTGHRDIFNIPSSQQQQYAVSTPIFNQSQMDVNHAELYKLLINTVGYIYCIDPSEKQICWILDKNYFNQIAKADKNRLTFTFQDARDCASQCQLVEFYTDEDMETFHESLKDKK